MTDTITKPKSGPEYGPTTWRCECGVKVIGPPFRLPKNWMRLEMTIGMGMNKYGFLEERSEDKTLCPKCAFGFRVSPVLQQAKRLLPP